MSPLLNLPAELRNLVCYLTVVDSKPIDVRAHTVTADGHTHLHGPDGAKMRTLLKQPGFTRTWRLARTESLWLFYEENTFLVTMEGQFEFTSINEITYRWLHSIGSHNRALLRKLYMPFRPRAILDSAPHLLQARYGGTLAMRTVDVPSEKDAGTFVKATCFVFVFDAGWKGAIDSGNN